MHRGRFERRQDKHKQIPKKVVKTALMAASVDAQPFQVQLASFVPAVAVAAIEPLCL
jgi:hypothetical protein